MSALFTPLTIDHLTLPNRIIIAPMCQYSAVEGCANDWHVIHLGHLALSGAGLLFTEATAVTPEGRISPGDLGLWSDENEAALAATLASVRRHSPMAIGIQLAHAGRKASCQAPWEGGAQIPIGAGGWQTVAPSALPHNETDAAPTALDAAGLERIRDAFVASARRAHRLGFDLIELHAAHGYLLHEFLSPLANRRDDHYGGSPENRMRFPLEVFDAVRAAMPAEMPVGIRISASDWVDGGWDIDASVTFAQALQQRGCSFIDVSSGGVSPDQQVRMGPGYQVPFAEKIREHSGLTTMAVGLITEPQQAEDIVASGRADAVALARGVLYNPRWPWHAAAALGETIDAPKQYWRSQPRELKELFRT